MHPTVTKMLIHKRCTYNDLSHATMLLLCATTNKNHLIEKKKMARNCNNSSMQVIINYVNFFAFGPLLFESPNLALAISMLSGVE